MHIFIAFTICLFMKQKQWKIQNCSDFKRISMENIDNSQTNEQIDLIQMHHVYEHPYSY